MSPDLTKLSLVLPSTVIITHSSLKSPILMSEVVSKRRLCASFLLAVHVHSCTDGTCVFPRSGERVLLPLLTEVLKGKEHSSLHSSSVVQLSCSPSGCSYQKTCTGATELPGLCSILNIPSLDVIEMNMKYLIPSFLLLNKESSSNLGIRQVFFKEI